MPMRLAMSSFTGVRPLMVRWRLVGSDRCSSLDRPWPDEGNTYETSGYDQRKINMSIHVYYQETW